MTLIADDVVLEMSSIRQAYGDQLVVDGCSLLLRRGEIACLLGPSGCGKTTVLRTIAGFEPIIDGEIRLRGEVVSTPRHTRPPEERRVGMVFQDFALFPHLTIAANVGFGLSKLSRAERDDRVGQMLDVVNLRAYGARYPHELSGGQQQRVALARALAPGPSLLLLDEPFSNLDAEFRERLSLEVRDILKASGVTAILVTHDQNEAFAMADIIGVMHRGRVEQLDTAYNLYHRPATRFVADFIGEGVLMRGELVGDDAVALELGTLRSPQPLDIARTAAARSGADAPVAIDVLLRPDDVVHDDSSEFRAEVLHKAFRGAEILYTLKLASGGRLLALVPSHHNHAIGEWIGIRIELDQLVVFEAESAQSAPISPRT